MSRLLATVLALAALPASAAWGEEPGRVLRLRVHPSGYEKAPETLDEKVARRMRELDYKFRLICRGCLSPAAEAQLERLPDPNVRLVPVEEPAPALTAPTIAATAPP